VKKNKLIFLISILSINMEAQKTATIAGEYYLRGVMETGSGFKLNEDGSFEFFFSYGALDRSGQGTWKLKDNKVILTSPKPKEQGFVLVTNKAIAGNDSVNIRIIEENAFFLPHVYTIVKSGSKQLEAISDRQGNIKFPKQPVDSIVLMFELCPEKTAVFAFTNKDDNYFEFRFDHTIMELFFDNLVLDLDDKGLSGQHPLLKEGTYHFIKN
jgi:hypothetical protein